MIFERKNISRSISILRRNKRNKDKEIPRAGWKNVNQEDNNNNKIRRRRVSREIILQILFPRSLENLAGSYTEYGINGIQGTCRILDPTQTSERKFRPRFLVEFSPSLSLSRPRAEKDNRGCSLNGKKAGIKWRWFTFTWCIEAWGWKMRRGADREPSRFFLESIELESRNGLCSIRADFHRYWE